MGGRGRRTHPKKLKLQSNQGRAATYTGGQRVWVAGQGGQHKADYAADGAAHEYGLVELLPLLRGEGRQPRRDPPDALPVGI